MIISFVNQKGGVGKSTLSFHFANWLRDRGFSVALYDADAQASSSKWLIAYGADISSTLIDTQNIDGIPDQILELDDKHDFTICDGPGGLGEVTRTLLILSDFALFPITASYLDADSLTKARAQLDYAIKIKGKAPESRVILNRIRKRSKLAIETREAQESLGIPVLQSSVRDLDGFRIASQEKTVVWKGLGNIGVNATKDLEALFQEIAKLIGLESNKRVANG